MRPSRGRSAWGDRFERFTAGAVESAELPCGAPATAPFGVHLELLVEAWVVLVPSGIGIRQPWVGKVPYVESGACEHPIVTREPTGVLEVAGPGHTLGDLFAIWGEPLGPEGFAKYQRAARSRRTSTGSGGRAIRPRSRSTGTPRSCCRSGARGSGRTSTTPFPAGL